MRLKRSFKSHYLFLRIIALVSQSTKSLTVAEIAETLKTSADTVSHCIGLHLYFERKLVGEMTIPPPIDYWAPAATDVIGPELLDPRRAGRMFAVETAMRTALAEVVEGRSTVH
jgi:hypothetical protein